MLKIFALLSGLSMFSFCKVSKGGEFEEVFFIEIIFLMPFQSKYFQDSLSGFQKTYACAPCPCVTKDST